MATAGKARTLLWPATAATAITVLFLWSQSHPVFVDAELGARAVRADGRAAETRALPVPWTLADARPAHYTAPASTIPGVPVRFPALDRRAEEGDPAGGRQPAPPPDEPRSRVTLHAPVLDPREENASVLLSGVAGGVAVRAVSMAVPGPPGTTPPEGTPLVRTAVGRGVSGWPEPTALRRLLGKLDRAPQADSWARDVGRALDELTAIPSLSDPRGGEAIGRLDRLARRGCRAAERVEDAGLARVWLRCGHAIARRVAVWKSVRTAVDREAGRQQMVSRRTEGEATADFEALLDAVREATASSGDAAGWNAFLLVDDLAARETLAADERLRLAQRLLGRVTWHRLSPAQHVFLGDPRIERLVAAVRPWAAAPIDYAAVLTQLERQELHPTDLDGARLAAVVQQLRYAEQPAAHQVAARLNDHYRNANFRVAVSGELLERLIPKREPTVTPVNHRILGAKVRGASVADTRFGIRLLPSDDRLRLALETSGTIRSRTSSEYGPAQFFHGGRAEFAAETLVAIDHKGIDIAAPRVQVRGANQLRRMATDYDDVPLVGSLVRAVARARHDQQKSAAARQSHQLAQKQIAEHLENELAAAAEDAKRQFDARVLDPLAQLNLRPLLVDLNTTSEELAARYRVADPWQLAAFTPRPRAPRGSLLSVQVHQSMLNNVLQRALATDGPIELEALLARFQKAFDTPPLDLERIPEGTKIQFASNAPVVIEADEDRIQLTLRIVGLQSGKARPLRHFLVSATYRPEVDGLDARLVREGVLRISGARLGMRDRLPIRAIFNVVLNDERPLPLTGPRLTDNPATGDLAVTQLTFRDGWLGLAIGPATGAEASVARRGVTPAAR